MKPLTRVSIRAIRKKIVAWEEQAEWARKRKYEPLNDATKIQGEELAWYADNASYYGTLICLADELRGLIRWPKKDEETHF